MHRPGRLAEQLGPVGSEEKNQTPDYYIVRFRCRYQKNKKNVLRVLYDTGWSRGGKRGEYL